jgi:hypothetical protein
MDCATPNPHISYNNISTMNVQAMAALQNHQWQHAIQLLQQSLRAMKSQVASLPHCNNNDIVTVEQNHATKTVLHVIPIPCASSNERSDRCCTSIQTFGIYPFAFVVLPLEPDDSIGNDADESFVLAESKALCGETAAIVAYNLALTMQVTGLLNNDDALLSKATAMYKVAAKLVNYLTRNARFSLPHKWKLLSLAIYSNMKSMMLQEDLVSGCLHRIHHILTLNSGDSTRRQLIFQIHQSDAYANDEPMLSEQLLHNHYKFFGTILMCSGAWHVNAATAAAA